MPIALTPTFEDGCFSGSAIVYKDKLFLLYTGFNENGGGENIRQVQCLAESDDGVVFKKHGIVIDGNNLPEGYSLCDFRDPKVWRFNDMFWCAVAGKKVGGKGIILLFKSTDLFKWQFVGDLFGKNCAGEMIECPDYNEELGLLVDCEQFQPSEGNIHLNIHTTRFYTGKIDYNNGKFLENNSGIIDYGFDFYAPQIFAGAPVMIGWLNMWDRNIPSAKYGFAGMLTVPRKVEVIKGELYQTPIVNTGKEQSVKVEKSFTDEVKRGVITIETTSLKSLSLKLRKGENNYTSFSLENGEWVFDRSKSGEQIVGVEKDADSLSGIRRMPFSKGDKTTLTLVLDDYSVEIFENGKSLSATIYPPENANGLELIVDAKSCVYTKKEIKLF